MLSSSVIPSLLLISRAFAGLTDSSLVKHVDALTLDGSFKPIIPSYWTGYPHHRRTPFALSPDGAAAYLAYLDASGTSVHVQQVDPNTFEAIGKFVTVNGREAGGLIAHNDGFALLTNEPMPDGTPDGPPPDGRVPVLYRFTNGQQTFKTWLGGPNIHPDSGLSVSPDLNGDLVFSEAAGLYGAYFVVTDYKGWGEGHFADSIQYVSTDGTLQTIAASSGWGCSHNTGIAFEAADSPPFASICAEDHGAIWLNTDTRGMAGVKISNENVTNGGSNEPMGGMSGSYSGLARFINSNSYIFAWVSRGAINLHSDDWMGPGFTQSISRTNNRNVAIATFSSKNTLNGPEAISTVGAASGDDQVNWITQGTSDTSNAHVAVFDSTMALVTWEEASNPDCPFVAMGCAGKFSGTYFQLVDHTGTHVGSSISSSDVYVAGDMVTYPDGRICWPYVNMAWSLDATADQTATASKISFACMKLDVLASNSTTPSQASSSKSPQSSSTSTSSGYSIPALPTSTSSTPTAFASTSSTPVLPITTSSISASSTPASSTTTSYTSADVVVTNTYGQVSSTVQGWEATTLITSTKSASQGSTSSVTRTRPHGDRHSRFPSCYRHHH